MILDSTHLAQLTQQARSAAIQAGQYIFSRIDTEVAAKRKTGGDTLASQVVTEVDLRAQEIILGQLESSIQEYDLGLLTEEAIDDHSRLEKGYFWCIDPLDGTLPFTEQRTGYAVSIALVSRTGEPVVGVVYIPDLQMCYTAYRGSGVYCNDQLLERGQSDTDTLHFYMDLSFTEAPYYSWVKSQVEQWVNNSEYEKIACHADYGGVRNALGVLQSGTGCYFKFPKLSDGCGSIWDYAATRLFMQEMGLSVSTISGTPLHLNDPQTTFMNRQGILYATNEVLAEVVMGLAKEWSSMS